MLEKERTWLKNWRHGRNLTQNAAADLLNIKRARYAHFETGRRSPDPKTAKRMAETIGLDWGIFFE
ncbi:helix-turn-helix protein [compost metagenome]